VKANGLARVESGGLPSIEKARALLTHCRSVQECMRIKALAQAVASCTAAEASKNEAAAIVLLAKARVGELTANLGSGAHTTTFSRMYRLDRDTAIIDTPGFQSFGLFHLTEDQIGEAMTEFRPFLGRCKFNDCAHLGEPGCQVIEASARGEITPQRLSFYQVLIEQHRELHEQHPDWSR